jgi:hypothetical protein
MADALDEPHLKGPIAAGVTYVSAALPSPWALCEPQSMD